ncbi:fumarylacetoacetate hydrolase family protein [Jiella sonneratiae]|uniref:Fumarylacetoacetate hydrolase family protein n=1 Tax=Jiella sonneratiae TaxID=2816856 RepID=A0ABS3J8T7_9HYPH|nr:fumarylacetoacetate hydrolase family protein [Jiella sonneratiae]MBO0906088.1 fumarylacetoacetate hydrolase family protein [Jiella sonneratiae]
MRICRFGDDRLGIVIDGLVHDVTPLQAEIRASASYVMKGDAVVAALPEWRERFLSEAGKVAGVPVESVDLLAPVARPSKTMAAPTNYPSHIAEMAPAREANKSKHSGDIGKDGIFLKANSAIVGPSEGVPLRFPERRTDHELEFVVVIGKEGSDIAEADALDHVAGYCLGLDMVVRGPEDRSFRKSCDGYAVLGPWLVTADELTDPGKVPLMLKVNGEVRQETNTEQLVYGVRRLIAFASSFYTLYPGDVFYTGTCDGVARVFPGDVITVESPMIGTMNVPVRAHATGRS